MPNYLTRYLPNCRKSIECVGLRVEGRCLWLSGTGARVECRPTLHAADPNSDPGPDRPGQSAKLNLFLSCPSPPGRNSALTKSERPSDQAEWATCIAPSIPVCIAKSSSAEGVGLSSLTEVPRGA